VEYGSEKAGDKDKGFAKYSYALSKKNEISQEIMIRTLF